MDSKDLEQTVIDLTDQINTLEIKLLILDNFFKEVRDLTLNHDVNMRGVAIVYPSKLGVALEKVDKDWWKEV